MIFTLMMLTAPLAGCTVDDPADVGCTNIDANNYNENVTKDDGSCDYDLDNDGIQDRYEVDGCTDNTANNYMISATDEDGSCDYDLDDDGILDADEILGCTDSTANNYNSRATDEDGSCDYDLDDDEVGLITVGDSHTCAILDNGSVSCWGYNGYGQLGIGNWNNQNTPNQTAGFACSHYRDHPCSCYCCNPDSRQAGEEGNPESSLTE